jgi:hypothetical protein
MALVDIGASPHRGSVMVGKLNSVNRRIGIILFGAGLAMALTSALLLFLGVLESGWAGVVGIVGIGLIATSRAASWTDSTHG